MHILQNQSLKEYTSLQVGGPAEKLLVLSAGDSLGQCLKGVSGQIWVLGYGTNCLISDTGLPGTVILNQRGVINKLASQRYKVDSGVNWDNFIQETIADNLYGLEFTSGIPGGIGAAVVGNIAAYGHKVADCLVEATILDSSTGQTKIWPAEKFQFDYRSSILGQPQHANQIVLDATFELNPELTNQLEYDSALKVAAQLGLKPDDLANRRRIIMETRRQAGSLLTDSSGQHHNAGSFFKNPIVSAEQAEKVLAFEEHGISRQQLFHQNAIHSGQQTRVSAALVLLAAGFQRGQVWGQVRLHPDHILKLENLGQATASEIYAVAQEIMDTVKTRLDIDLEPEVRFLGQF